jgi:hypothetical protein
MLTLRVALIAALGSVACTGEKSSGEDSTTSTGGGVGGEGSGGEGSGGEGSGGEGSGGEGSGGEGSSCESPEAILDSAGAATGYVRCADGAINRTSAEPAPTELDLPRCEGTEDSRACETDADCTDGPNGACLTFTYDFDPTTSCGCVYPCGTDADCRSGEICLAPGIVTGNEWATCVRADCTTDADCATDECGISTYNDGCGYTQSATCREPAVDSCRTASECPDQCGVDYGSSDWDCLSTTCDIGRPLVDPATGQARTAPPVARSDWRAELSVLALPDDDRARAVLADHWTRVARMEHASVASFARFSLELLALGAPPALVREAHQAAADEVEHARLAFAVASAASGRPVGPGALDLGTAPPAATRKQALVALIREACVSETVGVAEARDAAARCTEPRLKHLLETIADDESRHATLAWKTLGWLLREEPGLRTTARAAFEEAIATVTEVGPEDPQALEPWGLVDRSTRRAVREQAVLHIVRPCMEAALG